MSSLCSYRILTDWTTSIVSEWIGYAAFAVAVFEMIGAVFGHHGRRSKMVIALAALLIAGSATAGEHTGRYCQLLTINQEIEGLLPTRYFWTRDDLLAKIKHRHESWNLPPLVDEILNEFTPLSKEWRSPYGDPVDWHDIKIFCESCRDFPD